jgi:hypothetical protein
MEEVMKRGANFSRVFHIGEVPATVHWDQLSVGIARPMCAAISRAGKIVIAPDN